MLVAMGIILPDVVKLFTHQDSQDFPDIFQERNQVRIKFIENPTLNNNDKIWEALFYQGCKNKYKYDLFPYEWYIAFNDSNNISLHTIHRMLVDTVYDKDHYVANASVIEFADRIESIKNQLEKNATQNY